MMTSIELLTIEIRWFVKKWLRTVLWTSSTDKLELFNIKSNIITFHMSVPKRVDAKILVNDNLISVCSSLCSSQSVIWLKTENVL